MLRPRRYRALFIFAVVFVVVFVHFARSRDWETVLPHELHSHDHDYDNSPPVDFFAPRPDFAPGSSPLSPSDDKAHSANGPPTKLPGNKLGKNAEDSTIHKLGKHGFNMFPQAARQVPRWQKLPEQFPLAAEDLIKLPTGAPKALPKLQAKFKDETSEEKPKRMQKLAAIKEAFEHAWTGYKASAMGHDELVPLRGGFRDPFSGWGATLVDTLDTLWIMGLKEEFAIAVDRIRDIDFTTSERKDIPVFEVVIRYLGGLLGGYDISGHKYPVLLDKAKELAEVLIGAFDTPNRMPALFYRWEP